ncbi:MAG: type II toxin-antitoxin system prevent-host-death family antitoxin [Proteobacteria bacterium]|nr:type II toxin-antitoxin system prevent-host-death family antitoxin [Pseudomonadota bacterium]
MPTVNLHAANAHFARLVDEAAAGAEIIVARAGKPVTKLVSLQAPKTAAKRQLGALTGVIAVPPDFDAPLPDEILDAFEGRD